MKILGRMRGHQPPHSLIPLPLSKGKGKQGMGFNKDHVGGGVGKDKTEMGGLGVGQSYQLDFYHILN